MRAFGEEIGEAGHRRYATSAVQEQERPRAVAILDGDRHRADLMGRDVCGPEGSGWDWTGHRSFSNEIYQEP